MKRRTCLSHLRCQDTFIIKNNRESSWRLAPQNDRLSHDLRSLFFKGGGRREECEARPRAPSTHYLLIPPPFSPLYAVCVRRARQMPCLAEDREGFTQGSRGICRARRAHARHPRTPLLSLLPIPYFGSPLHSGHALPSSPYSLLPTLEAHCIVATHYLLHSSPHSLLYPKYGAHLIESADHILSELFHGGACFREALLMHIT